MEILLKGIGVGFAVAAPVGPIGLLCIRRTLTDGRAAGLASGLGAATADAVYGLLVAAGFAATGVLLSYATPLQLGGGLLIALLGAMSIRGFLNGPAEDSAREIASRASVIPAYSTTFALTLSNPMTILAFVGLIAGLGASAADSPSAPYWLVAGVFIGSALWWLFLVHLALAARTRITPRVTRWFDLVSGLVLVVWGLWIARGAL
ncbi:LysE family translocator [Microbaculum marinisediminis]|uniref:LysE family translocator n=1 Tax=Microbaculum marinisediminis TaxID=2931392 RepID=A0AAW5R0E6_9HYPH|nr:LysE family translocator [Microbaculum sp. A6E488]MCT8972790.1 LysE family translocator [Microbaculum sp. A6E488]